MIDVKSTSNFFDRAKVAGKMSQATRKALSKVGAFIRTRARSLIRKRKAPSPPGSPPSAHQGDIRKIYFVYQNGTVVIGPVGFNKYHVVGGKLTAGTVPATLEFGGDVGIRERQIVPGGAWVPASKRSLKPGQRARVRMAHYEARPTMGPALRAEMPKIPDKWKNSIKGP